MRRPQPSARDQKPVPQTSAPDPQGYAFTARRSYLPSEIHWGHAFAPVITRAARGATQHAVDLARWGVQGFRGAGGPWEGGCSAAGGGLARWRGGMQCLRGVDSCGSVRSISPQAPPPAPPRRPFPLARAPHSPRQMRRRPSNKTLKPWKQPPIKGSTRSSRSRASAPPCCRPPASAAPSSPARRGRARCRRAGCWRTLWRWRRKWLWRRGGRGPPIAASAPFPALGAGPGGGFNAPRWAGTPYCRLGSVPCFGGGAWGWL